MAEIDPSWDWRLPDQYIEVDCVRCSCGEWVSVPHNECCDFTSLVRGLREGALLRLEPLREDGGE